MAGKPQQQGANPTGMMLANGQPMNPFAWNYAQPKGVHLRGPLGQEPEPRMPGEPGNPFDPPPEVLLRDPSGGRVTPNQPLGAPPGAPATPPGMPHTSTDGLGSYPTLQDYDYTPSWLGQYYGGAGANNTWAPGNAAGTPGNVPLLS